MKRRHRFAVFAITFSALVSCDTRSPAEQEQAYGAARLAASTQPTYPIAGPGLRFGMRSTQVAQHLDSLIKRDGLVWQLSTGQLLMKVSPRFAFDRLVRVDLVLLCPGLTNTTEYLELVSSLEGAYGKSHPNPMKNGLNSWFKGGTEVQLIAKINYGYCLSYIDLHQVQDAGM